MRTVFDNVEVYHVFASGTQANARNANNTTSFTDYLSDGHGMYVSPPLKLNGETYMYSYAYSYRACIGIRRESASGHIDFLLVTERFSNTTSNHQSKLAAACRGNGVVYRVDTQSYKLLVQSYGEECARYKQAVPTANKLNKWRAYNRLCTAYKECVVQREAFMVFYGELAPLPDAPWLALTAAEHVENDAYATEHAEKLRHKQELKERRYEQLRVEQEKLGFEALLEWRAGRPTPSANIYRVPVALRVRNGLVQTSYGASVSLREAKVFYERMQRREKYTSAVTVGLYTWKGEATDETITIGCHVIPRSEMTNIYPLVCAALAESLTNESAQ